MNSTIVEPPEPPKETPAKRYSHLVEESQQKKNETKSHVLALTKPSLMERITQDSAADRTFSLVSRNPPSQKLGIIEDMTLSQLELDSDPLGTPFSQRLSTPSASPFQQRDVFPRLSVKRKSSQTSPFAVCIPRKLVSYFFTIFLT